MNTFGVLAIALAFISGFGAGLLCARHQEGKRKAERKPHPPIASFPWRSG